MKHSAKNTAICSMNAGSHPLGNLGAAVSLQRLFSVTINTLFLLSPEPSGAVTVLANVMLMTGLSASKACQESGTLLIILMERLSLALIFFSPLKIKVGGLF